MPPSPPPKRIIGEDMKAVVTSPRPMSDRDKLFVVEYLVDLNASAAWIRAGGDPKDADKLGPRKRKHGMTAMAIERALAERSKRVGISSDRVLMEIARIALGDPRVLFREDGALRTPHEYNADDAAMIEGIKTRRIVEVGIDPENPDKQKLLPVEIQEVKLASKMGALTALGRHLGLFNDKLEVTLQTPLAQSLEEAFKRTGRGRMTAPSGETMDVDYEDITDQEQIEHDTSQEQGGDGDDLSLEDMLK